MYKKFSWNLFSILSLQYKLQTPQLWRVTWYMFAAKKINKNKSLINTKLIKQRKTIMIGIAIKAIFFEIMWSKFTLSKKNGHVAPKWVSAKRNIVKIIRWVSNWGNVKRTNPYKSGNTIGNLMYKSSLFEK